MFALIVFLVLFSFNANPAGAFPITGLDYAVVLDMFGDYELQDAFWTSLDVAVQVTLISLAVGTAAAFPLARARTRAFAPRCGSGSPRRSCCLALIGISLLVLLTTVLDLSLSRRTAVIGQSIFTTPFVILLVGARLQTLDRRLEWAASDLGADPIRRLRHVLLPALPGRAGERGARLHALLRRVHHHALPDRRRPDAPALHLHPRQVRDHAGRERGGIAVPARPPATPAGVRVRVDRPAAKRSSSQRVAKATRSTAGKR